MSFVHGKNAAIYVGNYDLGSVSNNIDMSLDVDAADTTTFGSLWKSAVVGTTAATVTVSGYYDPTIGSLRAALDAASPAVLTYAPIGATTIGNPARLVSVLETAFTQSSPVGGVVAFTASMLADGTVGFGDVLRPLGIDTNTTTGASKNDGAATTTGWTAHLLVGAVSAGSWVVKLEDSANNSDWADVTGGAFTAATTYTAQRISGAEGATLRRYVRYVATRTGGAATDTIYFLLAYARN